MLASCSLCQPANWPSNLDDHLQRRATDSWFDAECRSAKRPTRQLVRAYAAVRRRHNTNVGHTAVSSTTSAAADSDAGSDAVVAARAAWYDQRRAYHRLRYQKCRDFWTQTVESERAHPARLWRSVDQLLDRGHTSMASSIDVETVNKFFADKVAKVRASTDNAPPPTYTHAPPGPSLREFSTLSIDDIISGVRQLPDKSSAADPVPTFVLKQIIDLIAPFVTELFKRSLAAGRFPSQFKDASITPIVKKAGLDPSDASSYRPISNLAVLSKLLERLVARQLMDYLMYADLLSSLQSGFRPGH